MLMHQLRSVIALWTLTGLSNAATVPSPLMISYWGQNIAKSQFLPNQFEDSLGKLCSSRSYNVYHITGMMNYASVNGMPAIDFSNHCSFPTDVFPGWPKTTLSGFSLLNCPSIGKDIQLCQSLGKKVVLTISPNDALVESDPNSPRYPVTVAKNVWNLFLGGSSDVRPFGNVVLDGIDLHIWNNDKVGVELFTKTLRELMGDKYLLSDYVFGPSTTKLSYFDYITPFFIQSANICGYRGNNPAGFWSTIQQWSDWTKTATPAVTFALGLVSWYVEPWAQATLGDYIPPDEFASKNIVPQIKSTAASFSGFALQDASFDSYNFPCSGQPTRRYSDVLYQQLTLPSGQNGNNTSTANACVALPSPTPKAAVTTGSSATKGAFTFPSNATNVGMNGEVEEKASPIGYRGDGGPSPLSIAIDAAKHHGASENTFLSWEQLTMRNITSAEAVKPAPASIPPPSDSWRETIQLVAKRNAKKTVETTSTTLSDSAKWATSIQAFETGPFVAIGSASESSNLFIVENITSESQPTGRALTLRSVFTAPKPIYSLSVMGNRLITAGPNSRVQIFSLNTKELSQRGKGLDHLSECTIGHGKLEELKLSPPGVKSASVRVHYVEFMPLNGSRAANPTKYLALEGKKVHLWDLEADKIAGTEIVSNDQLMVASWSPHTPHSLLATAGVDHNLYVLDHRQIGADTSKATVWMSERAHGGSNNPAITAVQFSPFVPYWLASAGEDSVVKIWDLRFLRTPACRIDGHYLGVRSMAWSNTHANIIATGSNDFVWRAWAVDSTISVPRVPAKDAFIGCPGTEWGDPSKSNVGFGLTGAKAIKSGICVGANGIGEFKSEALSTIVGCAASPTLPNTFYSLSGSGEVFLHKFTDEVFKSVAPQRYIPNNYATEAEIEQAVHSRNLNKAFSSVVNLSRNALATNRTVGRTERLMIELCTAKQPIEPSTWSIPPLVVNRLGDAMGSLVTTEDNSKVNAEAIAKFRADLDQFSYFLPPSFGLQKQWYDMVPSQCRLEFEMVVLRFNILVDVLKGNWETIVKAEKMICKGMETDPTFMEPDTLKLLIEAVLPNDFIKGISMGIHFAEVIEDLPSIQSRFFELAGLFHLLFFPTVYDQASWLVEPSNLERSWKDGRGSQQRQIWLREYLDFLQNKDSDLSPRASMLSPTEASTISLTSNRTRPSISVESIGSRHRPSLAVDPSRGRAPSVANIGKSRLGKLTVSVTSPTVMEADEAEKIRDAIEAQVTNSKSIIAMARTELALIKCLQKSDSNETVAENIIQIVTGEDPDTPNEPIGPQPTKAPITGIKSHYKTTISATSNRLYLDALLTTKRYEEYFQMCFDFVLTYVGFDFSKYALRHAEKEGTPRLKVHVDTLYGTASSHLAEAIALATKTSDSSNSTSVVGVTMTGGTKALREGLGLVAKIGTIMAQTMEVKGSLDKEGVEAVAHCITILNSLLGQLSTSMFKILEAMERMLGKTGTAGAYARDAASLTIEDIRQACKGFQRPTDGKTRAFSAGLSAATGASVRDSASGNAFMEEVFSVVDKLAKVAKPAPPPT
ncbi:hypothetical protein HDU97_003250 [Phlyctochytrium planicorne]|nr:hypothetical protein HDU97_003250 [Phlyctochytrium planicorne]